MTHLLALSLLLLNAACAVTFCRQRAALRRARAVEQAALQSLEVWWRLRMRLIEEWRDGIRVPVGEDGERR
jgi:hypothetical protein